MHVHTLVAIVLLMAQGAWAQILTLTFDDLPNPPVAGDATSIIEANNGSNRVVQVDFDPRFDIYDAAYRISGSPGNPLFGFPASGNNYLSNGQEAATSVPPLSNDRTIITTQLLMTEIYLGRNTYYGFDNGGADQVTIVALGVNGVELDAVVCDLPEMNPGQAEALTAFAIFDPIADANLIPLIEGYRFDRRALGQDNGNYILDSITFFDDRTPALEQVVSRKLHAE